MIISRSILLRLRNVSNTSCTENQNTHYVFNIPPPSKSCRLWNNMEKNMEHPERPQMTIKYGAWALHSGYLRLHKHALKISSTYYFSTATNVSRTCLNVTCPSTFPVLLNIRTTQIYCVSNRQRFPRYKCVEKCNVIWYVAYSNHCDVMG